MLTIPCNALLWQLFYEGGRHFIYLIHTYSVRVGSHTVQV